MSETAPQPSTEQIPGQEQLFTERVVAHGQEPKLDAWHGPMLEDGKTEGWKPFKMPELTSPENTQPTDELPATEATENQTVTAHTYESRPARTFDRLARFFDKSAETADKGMEKARRFVGFLGRTATKGQGFIETAREKVNSGKEIWKSGGDTKTQRLGAIANKAVLQPALLGGEKAIRHMGGNLSQLRQENAQSNAGYMHTQAEMLARQAAAETDPEAKAKLELEIAKLGHRQTVNRAKAEVYAARAHRRRTGSPVRVIASEKTESVPVAKAA